MSKSRGRPPIDNPKTERLNIRFESDELDRLRDIARGYQMTMSDFVRFAIGQIAGED